MPGSIIGHEERRNSVARCMRRNSVVEPNAKMFASISREFFLNVTEFFVSLGEKFFFLFVCLSNRKNYNDQVNSCPRDWRLSAS